MALAGSAPPAQAQTQPPPEPLPWQRPPPGPTAPPPPGTQGAPPPPGGQVLPVPPPGLGAPRVLGDFDSFRECPECPEVVILPPGSFTMGSPTSEAGRGKDEGPQQRVTISRRFAIGKYEVTRDEFAAFARATGHPPRPCKYYDGDWRTRASVTWQNPGFRQTGRDPVVCVSWSDAEAYVGWLSQRTRQPYRLPSEAEWEYAARAGTATARFWGEWDDVACGFANVNDATSKDTNRFKWEYHNCRDGNAWTAPVGSYQPNLFRLHDMLGNAREWVADCYARSLSAVPRDGSARTGGTCGERVIRGGSWHDRPNFVRAANRRGDPADTVNFNLGFRVARSLDR